MCIAVVRNGNMDELRKLKEELGRLKAAKEADKLREEIRLLKMTEEDIMLEHEKEKLAREDRRREMRFVELWNKGDGDE